MNVITVPIGRQPVLTAMVTRRALRDVSNQNMTIQTTAAEVVKVSVKDVQGRFAFYDASLTSR